MKLTQIAYVLLGLFVLQKWASGRKADIMKTEAAPTDIYSAASSIWEALNGTNLTADGSHPNAQNAFVELTTGKQEMLGTVGTM